MNARVQLRVLSQNLPNVSRQTNIAASRRTEKGVHAARLCTASRKRNSGKADKAGRLQFVATRSRLRNVRTYHHMPSGHRQDGFVSLKGTRAESLRHRLIAFPSFAQRL